MHTEESIVAILNQAVTGLSAVDYAFDTSKPIDMAYQIQYPRLEFVLEGQLEVSVGNPHDSYKTIVLDKSRVLFVPSNGWNRPEWDKPVKTLSIIFANNLVGFSESQWDGREFSSVKKTNISLKNARICTMMLSLIKEMNMAGSHPMSLVSSVLALIQYLTEETALDSSIKWTVFDNIREYIENHFDENITRESVARHFYITPGHVSFLFKTHGHIKFVDHLNEVRLNQAKKLLKQQNLSVKHISEQCGFQNPNYFSRIFKQKNKCTPLQYRLMNHTAQ